MVNDRVASSMATGPVVKCMKILLTVFNVIFSITGIAFLAVGVWMKVELQQYMQLSRDYYINTPFIVIALGAVIFIVGTLGCCCTFKGQTILLYLYSVFLVIMFILELTVGVCGFIYRPAIQNGFQEGLTDAIDTYPDNKQAMDGLQKKLHCCGIDSYVDWFNSKWSRGQNVYMVPPSCCNVDEKTCVNSWQMAPKGNISDLDINTQGCYALVTDFMDTNFGKIGGIAIGVSFLQLFGAVLASCLAKNINKAKYEQVA